MLLLLYMKNEFTHSRYWLLYVVNIHPNFSHFMNMNVQFQKGEIYK